MLNDLGLATDLASLVLLATAMVAPPLHDPMTADELHWRIIGNSIRIGDRIEHIAFDGAINGMRASERYSGRWRLRGNDMCFAYEGRTEACYRVSMREEHITFRRSGRPPLRATLIAGNPNNL